MLFDTNAIRSFVQAASLLFLAAGCATSTAVHAPRNFAGLEVSHTASELRPMSSKIEESANLARTLNRMRCTETFAAVERARFASHESDLVLSTGDLLKVHVEDGEEFSGLVEIDPDGTIDLPYLTPVKAAGETLADLEDMIAHRLVRAGYYRRGFAMVTVERLKTGSRRVRVSGAGFKPGLVVVNNEKIDAGTEQTADAFGDDTRGARVSDALRRAAGVRPDADVANVILVRNGERRVLNFVGAFNGDIVEDDIILSGDEIIVPSRNCFQAELVRSSIITSPGVRLYMSNLTQPASSNSQSAINRDAINFPYGTRLLQAVVSANCVGGVHVTNANRYVVFMTKDWKTERTIVIERPIEALVRRADRDGFNPYLQEGDALACYDSAVTNARDVINMIGSALSPAIFARGLIGGQ